MNKWFSIAKGKAPNAADIVIYGDIGFGYSAADFNQQMTALGKLDTINLRINTHGGDVFQGNAIFNMLKRSGADINVTIDGLAASMGSVIAMVGKDIIMPENAMLMIHNPMGGISGGVDEIKSFADALQNLEDGIVKAYVDRTGLPEKQIRSMMDKETWLSAEQAVTLGFATKIEKPINVSASAYNLGRFKNVPINFGTQQSEEDMKAEDIKKMCALAGKSDLAAGLIEKKADMAAVMKAIEDAQEADKTAAAAAAATASNAAASKVDASAVRKTAMGEVAEIMSLCKLAGFEDKAVGFITDAKSVSDVIKALDTLKKERDEASANARGKKKNGAGTEVSAHHNSRPEGDNAVVLDHSKVWDKFNRRKAS